MVLSTSLRKAFFTNKLENRSGTLWEGRFKASLIDSDSYLLACYRYVDLNPVSAKIVDTPFEYRWSSFGDHVGSTHTGWLGDAPSFLALASPPDSGSIPINAASSSVEEFRSTLIIKSAPMFPEPMIATLTGIHAKCPTGGQAIEIW